MHLSRRRRSAVLFWIASGGLAVVTALAVQGAVGRAETTAARYGNLRSVAVARRAAEIGTVLRAGDVELRNIPVAFVPAGEVEQSPVGRIVVVPLSPGEVILAAKLAPAGLRGVVALLHDDERAVAVPVGPGTPQLAVGDRVDVLAAPHESDAGAVVVARATRVVAADDKAVTIAVRPDDALAVATAVSAAVVTLALVSVT